MYCNQVAAHVSDNFGIYVTTSGRVYMTCFSSECSGSKKQTFLRCIVARTPLLPVGSMPAGNREVWSDITCVCPVLPTYVQGAAAARGSAAGVAAQHKRNKYRNDIPGFAFFLPLAFETEGYYADDLSKLLLGFAEKRALADGYQDSDLKARKRLWTDYWLNHFAMVHARFLARCVLLRAAACKDAGNPPYTRATFVDVIASLATPPPPPRAPPRSSPPSLPGTASGAAHAPAH